MLMIEVYIYLSNGDGVVHETAENKVDHEHEMKMKHKKTAKKVVDLMYNPLLPSVSLHLFNNLRSCMVVTSVITELIN